MKTRPSLFCMRIRMLERSISDSPSKRIFHLPEWYTVQRLSNALCDCWLYRAIRHCSQTCILDGFQLASLWNPCTTQSLAQSQESNRLVSNNDPKCSFVRMFRSRKISYASLLLILFLHGFFKSTSVFGCAYASVRLGNREAIFIIFGLDLSFLKAWCLIRPLK